MKEQLLNHLYIFNIGIRNPWFILLILLLLGTSLGAQNVHINELMAVNQAGILDEDGEYSDWVEIYNPTDESINLNGYCLTDKPLPADVWYFPDVTIYQDSYLIVFCSGKNRSVAGSELHTNFKLSASGEYLAFFTNEFELLSDFYPTFPSQQTDISYGMLDGTYLYFEDPTPGSDNGIPEQIYIPTPIFDVDHGYYNQPFELHLTNDFADVQFYYTTDGSVPSTTNGTLYSEKIDITGTRVIRAVAVYPGLGSSKPATSTYLFSNDIIRQSNIPEGYPTEWGPYLTLSGNAIADYEMDPELMQDSEFAESVEESLTALPVISLVTNKDNLFKNENNEETGGIYMYTGPPTSHAENGDGYGWERPVSFEFFNAPDSLSFQIDCGIKLHGGHSRLPEKSPKHSFRLMFKSEYGPTKLNVPFFGDDAGESFNQLVLRAGFNNTWVHHSASERERAQYTRDSWTKDTQGKMGQLSVKTRYAHLFINGIYWGIYTPTELLDKVYAETYLDGQEDDFDVIKDYTEVADGNIEAWNEMFAIAHLGLENHEKYQEIQGNNNQGEIDGALKNYLDVENLADYMLVNMYAGNTDWDHHNWVAIRNRNSSFSGFRFFCWDAEHVMDDLSENVTKENNSNCPSELFQLLTQNVEFKRLFANRVQKHCFGNGAISPAGCEQTWMDRTSQVANAIDAEVARWGDYRRDVHPYQIDGPFDLYTRERHYLVQQDYLLNTYFPQRTGIFIAQLRSAGLFPSVDAPEVLVNDETSSDGFLTSGDKMTLNVENGTIYYTLDGTDPVVWESPTKQQVDTVIQLSSTKKVWVPTAEIGDEWKTQLSFDDSSWDNCLGLPGGVGYEDGSGYEDRLSLDVKPSMKDLTTSCFVRIPFTITAEQLQNAASMKLIMQYDDGFVAYLNGTKVAEVNAPSSLLYNAKSTSGHEANAFELFSLSEYIGLLKEGDNLLAIHGLNQSTSSSDFILLPMLTLGDSNSSGGQLATKAMAYSGDITLEHSVYVKARTFYNDEWSALTEQVLTVPDDFQKLKITEVLYHPLAINEEDRSSHEFLELKNTGDFTINLKGFRFNKGVHYEFTKECPLLPDGFVVLAANVDSFYQDYGFYPHAAYEGKLDNDGERICLQSSLWDTICNFKYNDGDSWPQSADGVGHSLVPTEYSPTNNQDSSVYWRASYELGGSPGRDDTPPSSLDERKDQEMPMAVIVQNYPNPFTDQTFIDVNLSVRSNIQIEVYDILGQRKAVLANRDYSSGVYQFNYKPEDTGSGIFMYRITVKTENNKKVFTGKLVKQ